MSCQEQSLSTNVKDMSVFDANPKEIGHFTTYVVGYRGLVGKKLADLKLNLRDDGTLQVSGFLDAEQNVCN